MKSNMSIIFILIISVILATGFTMWSWSIVIPAIFPGLVEAGYIASEINWWIALLLVIFLGAPFIKRN